MNTREIKQNIPSKRAKKVGKKILHWFEIALGVITLTGVIVFAMYQFINFRSFDWTHIDTFTESLKIILQLAIGIEVARMLFSYNLNTLIELAVFIVIRKMLLLEGDFIALLISVICLVILFAARHFFIEDDKLCQQDEE